jgi:hypothetical protein
MWDPGVDQIGDREHRRLDREADRRRGRWSHLPAFMSSIALGSTAVGDDDPSSGGRCIRSATDGVLLDGVDLVPEAVQLQGGSATEPAETDDENRWRAVW